jgi:hypothetical protein
MREKLRELAKAAGGDRWYALIDDYEPPRLFLTREADLRGLQTPIAEGVPDAAGRYLAAVNPATILELLDRLDRLEGALDAYLGAVEAVGAIEDAADREWETTGSDYFDNPQNFDRAEALTAKQDVALEALRAALEDR